MEHRIYKLDNRMTVLGLELTDIGVAAVSFFVTNAVVSSTLESRLNILFIIGATFLITRIWIGIKDGVPEKFFVHLVVWLAERGHYYSTPDLQPAPLVIDVDAAEASARRPPP